MQQMKLHCAFDCPDCKHTFSEAEKTELLEWDFEHFAKALPDGKEKSIFINCPNCKKTFLAVLKEEATK